MVRIPARLCRVTLAQPGRRATLSRDQRPAAAAQRSVLEPDLKSDGPRYCFACPTPQPVQAKGHPPWTFKAQCLVTGRVSTAIPYERFPEFGVLTADTQTGGPFPQGPRAIEDRMSPVFEKLQRDAWALRPMLETAMARGMNVTRSTCARRNGLTCAAGFSCAIASVVSGRARRARQAILCKCITSPMPGWAARTMEEAATICRSAHRRHHGAPPV